MENSIYMFKEEIKDFDNAINKEKFEEDESIEEIKLKKQLPFENKVILLKNENMPKWFPFFKEHIPIDDGEITNRSYSIVLLYKSKVCKRVFALCKGVVARHVLNKTKLETNFGLKICLNEIDVETIKSLDVKSINANSKQKRQLISSDSPLGVFGLEPDEEIIKFIGGTSKKSSLAKTLKGAASIRFSKEYKISEFENICEELYKSFIDESYKDNFPFIDDVQIILGEEKTTSLNNIIKEKIKKRDWNNIHITYPDISDYEEIDNWKIFRGRKHSKEFNELNTSQIDDFIKEIGNRNESIEIEKISLTGYNVNGEERIYRSQLMNFISAEISENGKTLILSDGKWYEIEKSFINRINKTIDNIPIKNNDYLPDWLTSSDENEYNKKLANNVDRFCLDRNLLQIDGKGKIEICDILETPSTLIHVKKYTGSQSIGHLMNQGEISALALLQFPEKVKEYIAKKLNDRELSEDLLEKPEQIEIVYGIGTKSPENKPSKYLPFFSKVALMNAKKKIQNTYHFKIAICKIKMI